MSMKNEDNKLEKRLKWWSVLTLHGLLFFSLSYLGVCNNVWSFVF